MTEQETSMIPGRNSEDDLETGETRRILKNVLVLSLACMVHFTAYSAAVDLQSSINSEEGLGTASLAAVYAGFIFADVFLPVVVTKWLGIKWVIFVCILMYMPYMGAQFKPTFYTMIPAALITGLGAGPLWCAQSTYLAVVSKAHSRISKIPADALLSRFMGLFFMIFNMNQVWGSIISSLVLESGNNTAAVTLLNASQIPEICGASFLSQIHAKEALPTQPPAKIHTLVAICLVCMACGSLIIAYGLDNLKRYESVRISKTSLSRLALLAATANLMMEPHLLLLVAITIFSGYSGAFFGADFTESFVSCVLGAGSVGFVMTAFGIANAIGSVVTGYLAKVTGRPPLIYAATLLHATLFVFMLSWRPQATSSYVLFVIAVLWGLAASVWTVQINTLFGVMFPGREEASFAASHLCDSAGYIIGYVISPYLYTSSKIYLMMCMMLAGVAGYFVVEKNRRTVTLVPTEEH